MSYLTKEALRIEIWSMLTDEAKEQMSAIKESYIDSMMADIDSYADGKGEQDLISFGNYLLSEERKESFKANPQFPNDELLEERLSNVHHADIENWKYLQQLKETHS